MDGDKTLFIMRQPPYGTSLAREALEAILAAGSFQQQVSVLFIDDGVLQLLNGQLPENIDRKSHAAMLQALPIYQVDQLFVDRHSLRVRQLDDSRIINTATVLNTKAIQKLMAGHKHILSF